MFDKLKVLLAKFYNSMPPKIKIAMMVMVSFVLAGLLDLLVRDITDFMDNVKSDYVKTLISGFIPFMTVVFNVIIQSLVDAGTKILAQEGDEKTISKLQTSIDKKQVLIDSGK